jgi:hypothetical protein
VASVVDVSSSIAKGDFSKSGALMNSALSAGKSRDLMSSSIASAGAKLPLLGCLDPVVSQDDINLPRLPSLAFLISGMFWLPEAFGAFDDFLGRRTGCFGESSLPPSRDLGLENFEERRTGCLGECSLLPSRDVRFDNFGDAEPVV